MTDSPSRTQPTLARDDRRQQLIRVQASFHQYLGATFANKLDSLCGGGLAVRHVDLLSIEIDARRRGCLFDSLSWSNRQWHNQPERRGFYRPR